MTFREHPLLLADGSRLAASGKLEALRRRSVEIFAAINEQPGALGVTSRYVLTTTARALSARTG